MTDREFADELKRASERICNAIFHSELDWVDIEIQINEMRWFCEDHAPDRLELFEMVYASRFRRLWQSWRKHSEWCQWEDMDNRWQQNITQW